MTRGQLAARLKWMKPTSVDAGRAHAGVLCVATRRKRPSSESSNGKAESIARTTKDAKGATLLPLIAEHVLPKTTVYTDEWKGYDGVPHMKDADGKSAGYKHRRIQHAAKVYVMGDIHTNSVEGFWSLIKRGIGGVYHAISQKYLQNYLDEYSFRYNRRFDTQPMFMSFLRQIEKVERRRLAFLSASSKSIFVKALSPTVSIVGKLASRIFSSCRASVLLIFGCSIIVSSISLTGTTMPIPMFTLLRSFLASSSAMAVSGRNVESK